MSEGVTCYERDEQLCDDQMCLRVGCKLRNERLSNPLPDGEAVAWRWRNEMGPVDQDAYAMNVPNLRRRANAVYLACDEGPAKDISAALLWSADEIGRLQDRIGFLECVGREMQEENEGLRSQLDRAKAALASLASERTNEGDLMVPTWAAEQAMGALADLSDDDD